MFVWQAHEGAVTSLAFGPDGQFLVSAGSDGRVKVWEPFSGAEQRRISPLADELARAPLRWLAVCVDGRTAVVARPSGRLMFLDLDRQKEMSAVTSREVMGVKRAPDGQSAFALLHSNAGPALHQYAFADGDLIESLVVSSWRGPRGFGMSPDTSRVVAGTIVYEWPYWRRGAYSRMIDMKDYAPDDLAFSADMRHLFPLVGGKVAVYSLESTELKVKLKGHCGRITAMAMTPDGGRLWTASHDATVKCWNTSTLTLDRTYTFQTGGLDCLAVSPNGNVAAVGSGQKGTITLWDLE